MSSSDHRTLPVPDGLAGERVDAALAQMFGLSRTRAAELLELARWLNLDDVTVEPRGDLAPALSSLRLVRASSAG